MTVPVKPRRLKEGSVVAVISPSLAGPYIFPKVYQHGVSVLRDELGLEVVEMEHTRRPNYLMRLNPHLRGQDINDAFMDPGIDAIIATIGGDDSVRVLPHLRIQDIIERPKVLMGFSDTTTLLTYLAYKGMVTFYGPTVMAGISQIRHYPRSLEHLREMLFHPSAEHTYRPSPSYSEGYPDWSLDSSVGSISARRGRRGGRFCRAREERRDLVRRVHRGHAEVLKGTRFWPPHTFWKDKVLFMEATEQMTSLTRLKQIMRNYGTMEVFENISALLFGRWRGYTSQQRREVERIIMRTVTEEFGRSDLPIIMNMDFGHTDPQMILPLGVRAEVDPTGPTLTLKESPLI